MKKFLLMLIVIFSSFITNAQVANYTATSFNGNYVSLSGGTVFQSGTQLNTDAYSNEITLANPFTISGNTYNSLRIYNNGYITFGKGINNGQIMDALIKYPISNTVKGWSNDFVVSPFGGNLCASLVGNPEIKYGFNCGNDFVIQFQDLSIVGFTQTRATFQIIMKADGTTIQFVYGPNNTGQVNSSAGNIISPQVGIRGKSVLVSNIYTYPDWKNRSVFPGYDWINNTAGALSSSTCSWSSNSILPTSGFTIQWVI